MTDYSDSLFGTEQSKLHDNIERMKELILHVLGPDGKGNPAVPREQAMAVLVAARKMRDTLNDLSRNAERGNQEMQESHDEVRNYLLYLNKKYNLKSEDEHPLLKKMFNL